MSQAALSVGCPHCGASATVELSNGEGANLTDGNRLKGQRIACSGCGDEFSCYYY